MITTVARRGQSGLDPQVRRYVRRCVSPLLGPVRGLRVGSYDAASPALLMVLPELVEIHRRAGVDRPDYHLGGFGFSLDESIMKALGESMERATHFLFHVHNPQLLSRHTERELRESGTAHLPLGEVGLFTPEQLANPRLPAQAVDETTAVSWLPMLDLTRGGTALLPAQAVLAGFPTRDEPRTAIGITTGSAAHQDYPRALLGAILEMIQVDATMGHWYSHSVAPRIDVSATSTPRMHRFLDSHRMWLNRADTSIEFFWLRQPESWPVYVAACVIRRDRFPALAIGHGVACDLERAMYRALYEAIPISLVALMQTLRQLAGEPDGDAAPAATTIRDLYRRLDIDQVADLEAAVAYYALPEHAAEVLPGRFGRDSPVRGTEIHDEVPPALAGAAPLDAATRLIDLLRADHRLYAMDLTTPDVAARGLYVARLFSPDLMALCLPSFPEQRHPRFAAYGGFRSAQPHPYP
jgi:thiazole/oxazole-forming peptide maturase SagD family component